MQSSELFSCCVNHLVIRPFGEDLQYVGSATTQLTTHEEKKEKPRVPIRMGTKAGLGHVPACGYPKSLPKKIFTFTFPWTLCTWISKICKMSGSKMLHFPGPESFYTISLHFITHSYPTLFFLAFFPAL